jgi:microcystin-dependent protein
MQRIDNPPTYLFEDGDPTIPRTGTRVFAYWLNTIQEELSKIVENAGGTLNPADAEQVWTALLNRFDWWRLELATPVFVDSTSFKIPGDKTDVYEKYRSFRLTQTADAKGYVIDSSYHAGNDETTITVEGCMVDAGISKVEYGQPVKNEPYNTQIIPVGACMYWPRETPPSGWLERNGAAISRTTYADLFQVIGCMYGKGDGSTTFNLPDDRGLFIRAWDHGAGNDPDAAGRTSPFTAFTQTGDTANGSPVITNLTETDDLTIGMTVTGAGIPVDTEILSIDSTTQITLNQNATAAAVGVTLTFELIGDHVGSKQEDELESHTQLYIS